MVTVRKPLWHLPDSWRDDLWQEIARKAERGELGASLVKIQHVRGERGLELEFWFRGCTVPEASACAAAAIRDASSSITDPVHATRGDGAGASTGP